jgi:hypothetical protein
MKTKSMLVSVTSENQTSPINTNHFSRGWKSTALPGLLLCATLQSASLAFAQPFSIWNDATLPSVPSASDPSGVELGLRFRSSVDGMITGIRFYKGAANTGTHVGSLWTSNGTSLGSATFSNETASGWQQQALQTAIPISSNTTYVVSYHAPNGGYALNTNYFNGTGFTNPPLRALADGEDGPNGVFSYSTTSTFPVSTFASANYWVDVVMTTQQQPQDTNAPVLSCPGDVQLLCANCDTSTNNTGSATATDQSSFTISYNDVVSGTCPQVTTRTWTATDAFNNSSSCMQTITCSQLTDTNPPAITCPHDVLLQCANCNTDPSNTGTATATDESSFTIGFTDVLSGSCPLVTRRTWTATDAFNNSSSCVQTITCLPPSMVTDSDGCSFDSNPSTPAQDFSFSFVQGPCYRMNSSDPGQFAYNVFYLGTAGQKVTFNLTLPYPFITQSSKPIQAYDWVSVVNDGGQQCLVPGKSFFSSGQQVSLKNYPSLPGASVTVPVTLTVPRSGAVYLSIHLANGLKGTSGYRSDADGNAFSCNSLKLLIPNHTSFNFSVSGAQTGITTIQNINSFKGSGK